MQQLPEHLVLFDGTCGLCDHTVQFLLNKDRKELLHFSPLQGAIAAELLTENPELQKLDSILYVHTASQASQQIFAHSAAAIELCRLLPPPWSLISLIRYLPRPIRDLGYKIVAQNRLRIFGTVEACRLPSESERARFL
jgi:predicted DCC family thiol-disulfide oxidoreductase YuxK